MGSKILAFLIVAFSLLVIVAGLGALFALPVWLLWNWVAVTVLGLKSITFLQAWGINALCGFLFKATASSSSKS